MGRPYNEYCPIACALGVVGERWALLVVRELMLGPMRYTDLLERLPGCSTNMLAARLRELEDANVIVREKLPPPAHTNVYALTPAGEALRTVLRELAWWGAGLIGPPPPETRFARGTVERILQLSFLDTRLDGSLELRVDGDVGGIAGGAVHSGSIGEPDVVVTTDPQGLYAFLVERDLDQVVVEGDLEVVERFFESLPTPPLHAGLATP